MLINEWLQLSGIGWGLAEFSSTNVALGKSSDNFLVSIFLRNVSDLFKKSN